MTHMFGRIVDLIVGCKRTLSVDPNVSMHLKLEHQIFKLFISTIIFVMILNTCIETLQCLL